MAASLGIYLLTINDAVERWDVAAFNAWVMSQGERIGQTFQSRLDQFRQYTSEDVTNWDWQEDQ